MGRVLGTHLWVGSVYLGVFAGDPPVGGWGGSCFGDPPVGGFGREPPVGGCILEGLCLGPTCRWLENKSRSGLGLVST